ncbi:TetR/AcrR family transcriptional regulator [Ornithinibacillus californiensis]|uniref:TetR/AcrR family transcriptional regulator n=1 Tax=Ornithinibacillus californiensis TaxID=161536 RepID=UPI00064DE641|nr:TetR/AcrR family transcriptional regulator [Ornithinibacillus californiensis]
MYTTQKLDRRVRRTKQTFIKSYISLIKEKGYRNVTVTDVVNKSDYNRATFYAHFKNIEDLTNEIIEKTSDELQKAFLQNLKVSGYLELDSFPPSSMLVFQYIYANTDLFDLLKESESIPGLQEKMIETIRKFQEKIIFEGDQKFDVNNTNFITYRTYGAYGLILEWIKSDYAQSPEEMSKQMVNILHAHYPKIQMRL